MSLRVRIPAGESLSDPVHIKHGKFLGLVIPDYWVGDKAQFQAGGSASETKAMYDQAGELISASLTADSYCAITNDAIALAGAEYLKIQSGTHAVPVAQFGTAASAILDFGDDRKLTITSGVGGTLANKTVIDVTLNDADTLVVDNPLGEFIRIRLADTTASNNTAAAIQAAIRALGTTEAPGTLKNGLDVSALTVTGSAEYTAAPATFEKASIAVVTEDVEPVEKILTFTAGRGGDYQSRIALAVSVNEADTLDVSAVAVETEEGVVYALLDIKLANQTASKNTAAAIQAAIQALADVTIAENYTEFLSDLVIDFSAMTVEASDAYAAAPSTAVDTPINGFNFTKEADSFPPNGLLSGGDDCWLDVVVKD